MGLLRNSKGWYRDSDSAVERLDFMSTRRRLSSGMRRAPGLPSSLAGAFHQPKYALQGYRVASSFNLLPLQGAADQVEVLRSLRRCQLSISFLLLRRPALALNEAR